MWKNYNTIVWIFFATLIVGCGRATPTTMPSPPIATATPVPPTAVPTDPPPTPLPQPVFEPGPCRFDIDPGAADCGDLIVPEDRAQPDGPVVRLHVAIFYSTSLNPEPDPVIYLMGGAGRNALDTARYYLETVSDEVRKSRDFIIYNQRGTHYNEPFLECPGKASFTQELQAQDLSRAEADERTEEFLLDCRDHLLEQGINLAMYNSVANAADANDLRIALGYEKANYYGTSYGTRLGLTLMRYHPEGIRSIILDSVFPPQVDHPSELITSFIGAIDKVFESCSTDAYCSSQYPDLEETFYRVVDDLHANPVTISIDGETIVVDDTVFLDGIQWSLHSAQTIPDIPYTIKAASQSNFQPLRWTITSLANYGKSAATGVVYSSLCKDEISFDSHQNALAVAADYAPWIAEHFASPLRFNVCEAWPTGVAEPVENKAVVSDIPALIFSGWYDSITSPEWCQRAAETLSNSYSFEFPNRGHSVMHADRCAQSIGLEFLDDPTMEPDGSCVDELTGPDFR